MYITLYSYNQNGKNYISTSMPPGMQSMPTFDIYLDLPCPNFVLENILNSTNTNNAEFLYKVFISVSENILSELPIVDNHYVASLWLMHHADGLLYYTLEHQANATILKIDPPHPIDIQKLQNITAMYLDTLSKMQAVGKSICVEIVIRIPV
jgi:hypothetical protein